MKYIKMQRKFVKINSEEVNEEDNGTIDGVSFDVKIVKNLSIFRF